MTATSPSAGQAAARHAKPSPDFEAKLAQAQALLERAARDYAPVTQASSLGAEDAVITHLIAQRALPITVFVLDTGLLHPQTLALLERTQRAAQPHVTVYRPAQEAVVQFVTREGADAMYRSIALRKACCNLRKLVPLAQALHGQRAWITGLRREQSAARADVPPIDTREALIKFNPLSDWTWGDVWHHIATRGVDYNALHDDFFPSIGCAPCTRAISLGEDFRAGRWWWENDATKECGLHATPSPEVTA